MASIADVYVTVLPETGKIASELKKALLAADKDVRAAASRWKKEIENELKGIETRVQIKVDKTKAKKEIEEATKDQMVLFETSLDKPSAVKTEGALDAVARTRDAKIKVTIDKASLAKAKAELGKSTGFGKGAGLPIPGARGSVPPAIAIEALGIAPNVVPLVGSMVQSVGQLSGALALVPAVVGAAGLAIGSLKIGLSGFGDALKEIGDPTKFAEAIKTLSPAAREAATAIQGLMPQVYQLKATVQDALFAGMGEQISKLGNTYLPIFQTVMSQMTSSANKALTGIGDMLQTSEMQGDIKTFGANAARAFDTLMQAAQPFVKALSDIMVVGSSFLPQLAGNVADLAKRFGDFIGEARESGKLAEWIQNGITAFTQLKDIAVNVWNIFKGIFEASGSGDFLETVVNLTTTWSNWVNSIEGQNALREFFADAKQTLEEIWPILRDAGIALYNAFKGAKDVIDQILPVIESIAGFMARNEELCYAIGAAIAGWKLYSVVDDVVKIGLAFTGLQATAGTAGTAAGNAFGTGLSGGLSRAGLLLRGGAWALPVAILATIIWGDRDTNPQTQTSGQPGQPQLPGAPIADPLDSYPLVAPGQAVPPGFKVYQNHLVPADWTPPAAPGQPNRVQPRSDRPSNALPALGANPPNRVQDRSDRPGNAPQPAIPPVVAGTPPTPSSPGGGGGPAPEPVAPPGMSYDYTGYGELNWNALAELESGGNPQAISSNGVYKGLYQFDDATWLSVGGDQFAPTADKASESDQKKAAIALYNSRGTAPWPVNGWVLTANDDQLRAAGLTAAGNRRAGGAQQPSYPGSGSPGGLGAPQPLNVGPGGIPTVAPGTSFGASGSQQPAQVAAGAISQLFPGIETIGGQRPDSMPYHREGRAIDVMIPNYNTPEGKALGDKIQAWAQQNAGALGLEDTIWQDFWQPAGGGEGHSLGRKGQGDTAGHMDHVHLTFKSGGRAQVDQLLTGGGVPGGGGFGDFNNSQDNPMYVNEVNPDTGGKQLGQDIMSGVMEIFGLGDIFPDPTQFGLFKIMKSVMGLQPGGNANGGNNPLGGNGGGNGGGGMLDFFTGLIPGANGGGTGGLTSFAGDLVPGGGNVDNSNQGNFNLTVTENAKGPAMDVVDNYYLNGQRSNIGAIPGK